MGGLTTAVLTTARAQGTASNWSCIWFAGIGWISAEMTGTAGEAAEAVHGQSSMAMTKVIKISSSVLIGTPFKWGFETQCVESKCKAAL
jgi:hypothetical protein